MQSLRLPVAGLMTDPGPFTAAPEGSLVEAQNVVVLRPGVIEPRPGTRYQYDSVLDAGGYTAEAFGVNAASAAFFVASTLGGAPWIIRRFATDTITGPSAFVAGRVRFKRTGGRMLLTTENGVCTMPDQLASPKYGDLNTAYRAGLPQPYAPAFGVLAAPAGYPAGANWLTAGSSTAYRVTLRRRLMNGTLVESAPSGRIVVTNSSGGSLGVMLNDVTGTGVYYAWFSGGVLGTGYDNLFEGDELCIYRAPMITGTPSDAMRLRAVLTFDTTFNGFCGPGGTPWFDGLADAAWTGEPLYTSGTQESAGLANFRPDYARDVELYQGMTFYGGARTTSRLDLTLKKLGARATVTDPSQAICSFDFQGNITSGSPTITAVTNIGYFAVGQVITLAAQAPGTATASFPADTYVTAINVGAATVTLSANAGATTVGANCIAWDWIAVDDGVSPLRIYHYAGVGTAPTRYFNTWAASLDNRWNGDLASVIQLRCTAVSQTEEIVVSIFQPNYSDIDFVVTSTKPYAWDRFVGTALFSDPGVTSQKQGGGATLRWSKVGEPEHCPEPYRTVVGDAESPIRRIVAARQSLLVFKDDGLFQVFGADPGGLQFEMLDSTILLPGATAESVGLDDQLSKWVARFDDRVFAMTTRGPMAITDAGATLVGAPILESLRQLASILTPSLLVAVMVDPSSRRVGFFYDSSLDASRSEGTGYVLDTETGTWVKWTFGWAFGGFGINPFLGTPTFAAGARQGSFSDSRDRLVAPLIDRYPHTYEEAIGLTCTINSVTGSGPYTVTIAGGSKWTPAVGDIFFVGASSPANTYTVTAVTSSTVFETDRAILAATPVANVRWGESFESRVVWVASAEGNVAAEKHWSSFALPFERVEHFARVKSYFQGYRNNAAAVEAFFDSSQLNVLAYTIKPAFKRARVPTACARDWALKAGFSIRQAGCWFSTSGCSLLFEPLAPDKVAR